MMDPDFLYKHARVRDLKGLCRKRGLRNYSYKHKYELCRLVCEDTAARKMQHLWKHNRVTIVNVTDPFTLSPFDPEEKLFVTSSTGNNDRIRYQFRPRSLMRHFVNTGGFHNPYTREDLSDDDLRHLKEAFLAAGGPGLGLSEFTDIVEFKAEVVANVQQERLGNQRCTVLVHEIKSLVNGTILNILGADHTYIIYITMMSYHVPAISDMLREIRTIDPERYIDTWSQIETTVEANVANLIMMTGAEEAKKRIFLCRQFVKGLTETSHMDLFDQHGSNVPIVDAQSMAINMD